MKLYPWQTSQWHQVTQQCASQWTPQAFLLTGPRGLGKMTFAVTLAQWLLCEIQPADLACDECRSCQWMKSQTHPDFFSLFPEGAQSVIKIDAIRDLVDQLVQTTVQSRMQAVLIAPAEAMNKAAANALLKTLEEPLGRVCFILVSHQPDQIPVTIRSRVQSVRFSTPLREVAQSWLAMKAPNKDAALLLSLSDGLPLKALSLAEENTFLNARNTFFDHLKQLTEGHTHPVQVIESIAQKEMSVLFEHWLSLVIDLMRFMMGVEVQYLVHQDQVPLLTFFAEKTSLRAVVYYQHTLREALRDYRNHSNLNPVLLLEYLLIRWRKLCS